MSLRSSRAALVALAAGGLLVATAGAASAETLTVTDHVGDTWKDTVNADGTETYTPAGSALNTDLKRTVVRHTATRVVIRATYAELKKSGPKFLFGADLRTNEGLRRSVTVDTMSGTGSKAKMTKLNGQPVTCAGIRHSIDWTANQVTVSFPRACVSQPRWIQVRDGAVSMTDTDFFVDNGANTTHQEPTQWSARIHKA
jgi:hypothetical protein